MIPKELYYTKDHEWIKVDNDNLLIGITHYAQDQLGDIVYVELPEEGKEYERHEAVVVIESVKTASDVYMPVDGKILNVNNELEDHPELINEDCYKNYIFSVKVSKEQFSNGFLTANEYEEYIKDLKDE